MREDPSPPDLREPCAADRACLAAILAVVRDRSGTDFRGYRPRTALRRVHNRMLSAGVRSMPEYLARLREDPLEAPRLVERLTIKVSRFFRNPDAVAIVRDALASRRAARRGEPLTAWSAGCARGEEPYTIAILLAELGEPVAPNVVATDVDGAAIAAAGRGAFPEGAVSEVPPALRARHLEPIRGGGVRVRGELRRRVELRLHDLTRADVPPDDRTFDLVACRNVLMYLQDRLRQRVERLLLRALAPGGLLWLGEAEWPRAEIAGAVEAVDRKARLFRAHGGRTA